MNRTMPRTAKAASSAQKIPQLNVQISDIAKSPLTEDECRSLRRIQSLSSSSRGFRSHTRLASTGRAGDIWKALLLYAHSFVFHSDHIPVLEGKLVARSIVNPKVILASGQDEAFAHLPGVGTRWLSHGRMTSVFERKHLWLCSIRRVLQPTRLPIFENCLPFPPLPLSEVRELHQTFAPTSSDTSQTWSASPASMAGVTRKVE